MKDGRNGTANVAGQEVNTQKRVEQKLPAIERFSGGGEKDRLVKTQNHPCHIYRSERKR